MKYILIALMVLSIPKSDSGILAEGEPFALVQLFTSQGCSSCPPADQLLSQVKQQYDNQNVYVISYHVDYWNRLGWKDPFSSSAFTELQYDYGTKFSLRSVYTPQAVINGKEHFVGSKRAVMQAKLGNYLNQKAPNDVKLHKVRRGEDAVSFNFEVDGDRSNKALTAVLVLEEKTTYVQRGENRKRSLSNENIALKEIKISLQTNAKGRAQITVPEWVNSSDKLSLIVFVQDQNLDITGAKSVRLL